MKRILFIIVFVVLLANPLLAQEKEIIRKSGMVACFGKETMASYLEGIRPENEDDCFVLRKGADIAVIREFDKLIQIRPWRFKDLNFVDNFVELWTTKETMHEGDRI